MQVYAPHGGIHDVSSVAVHHDFDFGQTSDLAVLKLTEAVTGIAPTPLNSSGKPAVGTLGVIAGFGRTTNNGPGGFDDSGIVRSGLVTTATCASASDANHVCWEFTAPVGFPGEDSSTCEGDSGGPLFVDFGQGQRLAGVISGGNPDCLPPDFPWAADVFLDLQSISTSNITAVRLRLCPYEPIWRP